LIYVAIVAAFILAGAALLYYVLREP